MHTMKKACLYISDQVRGTKNFPFNSEAADGQMMKNMLFPFKYLRNELRKFGYELATRDINTPKDSNLLFCWENPHLVADEKLPGQVWCLIINDPPIYTPETWNKENHERFDFVFTFNQPLIDNKKYFYYPFVVETDFFSIPNIVSAEEYSNRKLATFIANSIHKFPDRQNPDSIIHLRYEIIRWYAKNCPNDFDFYGGTFKERNYYFGFRGVSLLKSIIPKKLFHSLASLVQRRIKKVYGGKLKPLDKFEVIKRYNFYYCLENTIGEKNGYISEKIFECFYSGIVPIYYGAPDIRQQIPYKCFIEYDQFKDQNNLYHYIKNMRYDEYRSYIEQAILFLKSNEMKKFSPESFASYIISPLIEILESNS